MTAPTTSTQPPNRKRVLIVHGYGANIDAHWFPWLRETLGAHGIDATSVALPHPDHPDAEAWEHAVADALRQPDAWSWIVAHSLGSITALRVLAARTGPWRLGGLILVAGFTGTLDAIPALDDYLADDVDAEHVGTHIGTRLVIRSDDDELVPAAASDTLAARLRAELHVQRSAGHFLASDGVVTLPIVLDTILGTKASAPTAGRSQGSTLPG